MTALNIEESSRVIYSIPHLSDEKNMYQLDYLDVDGFKINFYQEQQEPTTDNDLWLKAYLVGEFGNDPNMKGTVITGKVYFGNEAFFSLFLFWGFFMLMGWALYSEVSNSVSIFPCLALLIGLSLIVLALPTTFYLRKRDKLLTFVQDTFRAGEQGLPKRSQVKKRPKIRYKTPLP
jgi:hypothetical protein